MEEHGANFYEDGTGKMVSMADFNIFITLCTEWNHAHPGQAEQVVYQSPYDQTIPQLKKLTTGYIDINGRILFDGSSEKRILILTLKATSLHSGTRSSNPSTRTRHLGFG
ncbi:unnamed protein product [Cyclocybe aegerita]|uniref:Uncharacterized protein n=1 Tax=Cyclocybe aegerita TaxID=1973307 RepID=A0A8S0VY74_CYCAE|nr:unnamed protein product [Cyclocybe aegerita]